MYITSSIENTVSFRCPALAPIHYIYITEFVSLGSYCLIPLHSPQRRVYRMTLPNLHLLVLFVKLVLHILVLYVTRYQFARVTYLSCIRHYVPTTHSSEATHESPYEGSCVSQPREWIVHVK